MNRTYRIASSVIGLAFVVTASVVWRPAGSETDGSSRSAADVSPDLSQEQQAEPNGNSAGDTAQEAEQYANDQASAKQEPQWQAITDHVNASRGPEQPIPFNHRFHTTDLQIDCMYCHTGTERSGSGIVPPLEVCMGCHRVAGSGLPPVETLRGYARDNEPIPWKWVNKLPEFVQFSHRAHLRNGLECQACHGPVQEMDRVYQWAPLKMGWCLECHRGEPQDTDVATTHLLSQSVEPIAPADERQSASYYPRNIDSEYSKFRAPTDCAACHY